jgi:hypothetical protein
VNCRYGTTLMSLPMRNGTPRYWPFYPAYRWPEGQCR